MAVTTSGLVAVAQQASAIVPTMQSFRGMSDILQAIKDDYNLGADTELVAAIDLLYSFPSGVFTMVDEFETVVSLWETGTGTAGTASIDVMTLTF